MDLSVQAMVLAFGAAVIGSGAAIEAIDLAIRSNPIPAIEGEGFAPDTVVAGDTEIIKWRIVKRTTCRGTNQRLWLGDDGFRLSEPLGETTLPATGGWREYNIATKIPDVLPDGRIELWIIGSYECPRRDTERFSLGPVVMNVAHADAG